MTVNLVEKGPLVRLLNIASYQLTAIDSADETVRIEGAMLAEEDFSGSVLTGLKNDHNYTFALRVFYFPVDSAELSNLSLRIDYAEEANARNRRDAGGITIGVDTDGDYLADLVDGDDDNDGVNDLDDSGRVLDDCPRGETGWLTNEMTDNDGDGCRDAGEDRDDDNDMVPDTEDLGEHNGRLCRLFADCDNDNILDGEDLGEFNGVPCRAKPGDCDDDNIAHELDVDIDGDGLIEIRTAGELDAVRWALNGSGRRLSEGAILDQTGCGDGADRMTCGGYELVKDISLADYADGEGWQPIGQASFGGATVGCEGEPFSGRFEGNGHSISDLTIRRSREDCIGLFGYLAPGSEIRNLLLEANTIEGGEAVGTLVGWGREIALSDITLTVELVNGSAGRNGGLIGDAADSNITNAEAEVGSVMGFDNTGGLVGFGWRGTLRDSSVSSRHISGEDDIGGLAGDMREAMISNCHASSVHISGDNDHISHNNVGGLVGNGRETTIASSSSVNERLILGKKEVGGLLGNGVGAHITDSFANSFNITIRYTDASFIGDVGGLVGEASIYEGADVPRMVISSSSATTFFLAGKNHIGGLVGSIGKATINSSFAVSGTIFSTHEQSQRLGGLVGYAPHDLLIVNSFALSQRMKGVAREVFEQAFGGLIGGTHDTSSGFRVVYSYAVTGEMDIPAGIDIGGLIGSAQDTLVLASYAVTGSIRGNYDLGGLIGKSRGNRIISSYAVTGSIESETDPVGGLLGEFAGTSSLPATLVSSYALSGNVTGTDDSADRLGGLIGAFFYKLRPPTTVRTSFWDRNTSGIGHGSSGIGNLSTSRELQLPTDYEGIFADWDEGVDIDNADGDDNLTTGIEDTTIWCDEDMSMNIENSERRNGADDNRIWDFGSANEYPAIRCSSDSLQRRWWFINQTSGQPQLNASLLTETLREMGLEL